jgi:hypothetical protein
MILICFCLLNYSHPLTHYNRKLKQNCNRQITSIYFSSINRQYSHENYNLQIDTTEVVIAYIYQTLHMDNAYEINRT